MLAENSICIVYFNNEVAFTNRIENLNQNPWMIYTADGTVRFHDIKVYKQ